MTIQPLTPETFGVFIELIAALAVYEQLAPPDEEAKSRLFHDAFAQNRKFESAIIYDGANAVGYAIWFETYSSFLARPTMYLEDIFVLEHSRGKGFGSALFDHVHQLGRDRGCCRMEWQVLDWNVPAQEFYKKKGATRMSDWLPYRTILK
jgi:GNAT superfamily N-acetyltransferase